MLETGKKTSAKTYLLCGLMGAGKTTVGQLLAKELNIVFNDLDQLIIKDQKRSIESIFSENGEEYFREIETKNLGAALENQTTQILSLGGGSLIKNKALIKDKILIYLKANIDVLASRLEQNTSKRPLLKQSKNIQATLKKIMDQREKDYLEADIIIETSNKSPSQIVSLIKEQIQ